MIIEIISNYINSVLSIELLPNLNVGSLIYFALALFSVGWLIRRLTL